MKNTQYEFFQLQYIGFIWFCQYIILKKIDSMGKLR